MNVFIEYFNHKNNERKKEIDNTLKINMQLNFINKFYVFTTKEDSIELKKLSCSDRVINIIKDERCTFQQIFDFANSITKEEEINITMNNDIILSDSFKKIKIPKKCFFAISRWENGKTKPFCWKTCNSQDLWAWKGINIIKDSNFYFGILGCDNRLAYKAEESGYEVLNPAYTYICHHNHLSGIRHDSINTNLRMPPPYRKVCPCYL